MWMVFDKHTGDVVDGVQTVFKVINLFIDNGEKITIRSPDINKIPHNYIHHYAAVEGSLTNSSMMSLYASEEIYHQSMGRLTNYVKKIKDSIGFNGLVLNTVFAARDEINQAYYYTIFNGGKERDPELQLADIFLPTNFSNFEMSGHARFWIDFYQSLDNERKNSFTGKWLKGLVSFALDSHFRYFLPSLTGKY